MIQTGTIIHGTHRECDLISAFMGVLDAEAPEKAEVLREEYGAGFIDRCSQQDNLEYPTAGELDRRFWLLDDIYEAMESIAPEGTYFGTIEGDGSDFGFWEADDFGESVGP